MEAMHFGRLQSRKLKVSRRGAQRRTSIRWRLNYMEIIFEILFGLLQVFGEIFLQIVIEALVEFGLQGLREPFRRAKPLHPLLAAAGYALLGAAAGAISLWIFPQRFIATPWLRTLNLVITPIAAGAVMSAIGMWRRKNDKELIRLDRFAYGFLFAFAMAIVRATWGR